MAEGDTILRAARRIEEALGGEEVEVAAPNPRGRGSGVERLDGRRLERVEARGKNLLLRFGDLTLHSHLGMSGSWHVYPQGAAWRKPVSAAWAVLRNRRWEAVQFGGPTLRVLATESVPRDPQLARLGPDVLAADFDLASVVRSVQAHPELGLGEALLAQHLVAGIGNIFKSEACFAARVNPLRRVGELSLEEIGAVLSAARELMRDSALFDRRPHAVYKRRGMPCPACGTPIVARGQGDANRTAYWCPRCQPQAAKP